ncbi:MAG TPA: ABC transporter ATP-binding protein [Bacteroidales bacterium]|nr:ABC transporter ATP-binding protein [Bacteroidales bacterium]
MGHPSGSKIQGDILMEAGFTNILSFRDIEIGFKSGKSRHVLLPPLNGSAVKGELIAVIGKNGIGKSTLLRTFAGLQDLIGGNLTIDGENIVDFSRLQLSGKIGYISTEIVKVSNMKVYDLVSLGRFPHTNWLGRINSSDHQMILEAISRTGMADFRTRLISELSDGERQRAMIAMVLAQDAAVMIMDEPTAFLDISSKYEIIHLLNELTRNRNKTVIFSTHDLATAVSQADKIWLLKEWGITEGAPEDLMLDGSFETLFDSNKVDFNSSDGSFTVRNTKKGRIYVKGDGNKRYWTEKALIRAGYGISESESEAVVEVPSSTDSTWKCRLDGLNGEFVSVYELVIWLRNKNITSENTSCNYQ